MANNGRNKNDDFRVLQTAFLKAPPSSQYFMMKKNTQFVNVEPVKNAKMILSVIMVDFLVCANNMDSSIKKMVYT